MNPRPTLSEIIESIDRLVDRRDKIWKRLTKAESGTIALAELAALRDANEAVTTALNDDGISAALSQLGRIEKMRCTVCNGFIASAEIEIRSSLFKGNSAAISAAEIFLRNQGQPIEHENVIA